jgi:hypothetical protein
MAFLERLTPMVFGFIALGVFAAVLLLLRKRKRKVWQSVLLILTPILAVVIFAVVRYLILQSELDPFKSHLAEYLSAAEVQQGEAYIHGKIIPVNVRNQTVDYSFYYELPEELRASSPEEVGTVVWLDCTGSLVGTYTGGGGAYRWTCETQVVDLSIFRIVGEESFTGSDPPKTKLGSGDEHGSFPSDQIIAYLVALPRK